MNNFMMVPPKRPSWKEMSWTERKAVIKVMFWPYKNNKHNIKLYIRMGVNTVLYIMSLDLLIHMSSEYSHKSVTFFLILAWIGFVLGVDYVRYNSELLKNALMYEQSNMIDKIMANLNDEFKSYEDKVMDKLKKRSGRPEISNDPLTRLAALIDAEENDKKLKDEVKTNPLKAILEENTRLLDVDELPESDDSQD